MTEFDFKYQDLLYNIMVHGDKRETRNGATRSLFAQQSFSLGMRHNFPILTIKEVHFKSIVTELLWFLRGEKNIRYLVENGCNIWNGDAYKNYVEYETFYKREVISFDEFVEKIKTDKQFSDFFGNMGPIYGEQWRSVADKHNDIDQIENLIRNIKEDPTSRRLLVNSYNVAELEYMVLPPCHYAFQVYVDGEYLDMLVNMRSSDVPLGLPFNVTSYATLLHILSRLTNKKPNNLTFMLGDTHIYENQIEPCEELINRYSDHISPILVMDADFTSLDSFLATASSENITLSEYHNLGKLSIPLSN